MLRFCSKSLQFVVWTLELAAKTTGLVPRANVSYLTYLIFCCPEEL